MLEIGNLVLLLLGGVGATVIVVESDISQKFKNILEKFMPSFFMQMLNCYQCSGFWCGFLLSFFFMMPFVEQQIQWSVLGKNFVSGCAVSLLSVFWASFMLFIESKTVIRDGR